MQKQITIELPNTAVERINQIIADYGIFENNIDFIQHAITDLLEEYR
jgi:Arc/MetJ-type ribon-helix-helix transcriptional regulator